MSILVERTLADGCARVGVDVVNCFALLASMGSRVAMVLRRRAIMCRIDSRRGSWESAEHQKFPGIRAGHWQQWLQEKS